MVIAAVSGVDGIERVALRDVLSNFSLWSVAIGTKHPSLLHSQP